MFIGRIRFAIALLFTAVATFVFGTGFLLTSWAGRRGSGFSRWARGWARTSLFSAGIRMDVRDRRANVTGGPCVFVANHQSALDVPAVLLAISEPFGFVAKRDLSRQPIVGAVLRAASTVFVDGSRPRESVENIHSAVQQIAAGRSILVFPEGERTWSTELSAFKRSAFVLAAKAGVPVVPVTLFNAHELLDERRWFVCGGRMRVVIDEPIRFPDSSISSIRAVVSQTRSTIEANLALNSANPNVT